MPPSHFTPCLHLQVIYEDKWKTISDKLVQQPGLIDHISNRSSKALLKQAKRKEGGWDSEEDKFLGNTFENAA